MKFYLLPIGEAFSYQGVRYTKSGPLTASSAETGANKMIPRSAHIQVTKNLDINDVEKKKSEILQSKDVANALTAYQALINECLMDIKHEVDINLYEKIQSKLGGGYRDVLKKLSLN